MSKLALKLIKEAKETRATRLDLGNCGLTELPDELFELTWLEELILSNHWSEYSFEKKEWENFKSQNNGLSNNIRSIASSIEVLKYLKTLIINGQYYSKWSLNDISPLKNLPNLQQLNISYTTVNDISVLNKMQDLQILDISATRVKNLDTLYSLINLKIVRLYFNETDHIYSIKDLLNLQEIDISYTYISDLMPLKNSQHLQQLKITSTLTTDLSMLTNLQELEILDIAYNQVSDLSPLANLQNLNQLNITSTKVSDLSPLASLQNLNQLNITSTKVSDLSPLASLQNLNQLNITSTKVSDLSPLASLQNLNQLNITSTKVSDLSPLASLQNLNQLDITSTNVSDLSTLKEKVKTASKVILNGKIISIISTELSKIEINVEGCNIVNPPFYIVAKGKSAILRYWQEIENKKTIINNQTKLIFIGNSRAGKTSLWQYLKNKIFNGKADSTHGIKTEIWDTEPLDTKDNQKLAAHIWDFGGQEYYHATHRFFLAENAVYVLVWEKDSNFQGTRPEKFKLDDDPNGEIEEVDLEHFPASYWLENIRYFGGTHCPVLIVQNKVDEEHLKANYSDAGQNIEDCFHLSVQNAYHFQEGNGTLKRHDLKFQDFKERLLELLRKNATAFKLVKYYAQVREALEALEKEKEYITVSELKEIALGFDEMPDLENLLAYLKSFTNTVLYFPQNPLLHDRLYLNPRNISRDIYKILNKTVRDNKGKFDLTHIQTRLNLPNYEEAERFLALMHEFDLIFEKQDENDDRAFIAPQYLQQKAGLATGEKMILKTFQPAFYLRFKSFVPRSMMLRFIAQNGASAFEEFYWRNGIVYQCLVPNAFIKVEYDSAARTFAIDVQDKDKQAVDMQQVVEQFVQLNNSDDNIDISNDGKTYIELKTIRKLQNENRRDNIFIDGNVVSLNEYDWLIKKQKTNNMTLEEIKNQIRNLISKAKTKEAIDEIAKWANEQNEEQLKSDISLLKGDWTELNREKTLGLLSNGEANTRQNQLANKILNLLNFYELKDVIVSKYDESMNEFDLNELDIRVIKAIGSFSFEPQDRLVMESSGLTYKEFQESVANLKSQEIAYSFNDGSQRTIKTLANFHKAHRLIKNQIKTEVKTTNQNKPLSIFVSYSKKDNELKEELNTHLASLRRRNKAVSWDDRHIIGGELWDDAIKSKLKQADIILFLVSANFIATDYIWDYEIPLAEEQRQNGKARVIPIILKSCQWTKLDFAKQQALPSKGVPINTFPDRDTAWTEVVESIERVINDVLSH